MPPKVSLPNWPLLLPPQQYAIPSVAMPQVWKPPALTAVNVSPPATAVGVVLPVVDPSPISPVWFDPQQYAMLLVVRPQVWRPALIVWNVRPPDTGTGVEQGEEPWHPGAVGLPSSPPALLPQQYASPAAVTPQA